MKLAKAGFVLAFIGMTGWLTYRPILIGLGNYLVEFQSPVKSDLIIVLGGDGSGMRALTGCRLLQQGMAPEMWISGAQSFYGRREGDLAIDFLKTKGCPTEKMQGLSNPVDSTRDEAIFIGRMMRQRGVKRYLLVTSNYHTKRSGRIFRLVSPDLECVVVSAGDDEFPVGQWWKLRHARKTFIYEWAKTVSYWVGL